MTTWLCCRGKGADPAPWAELDQKEAALPGSTARSLGERQPLLCAQQDMSTCKEPPGGEELAWKVQNHQHFAGLTLVQQSAGAEALPEQK